MIHDTLTTVNYTVMTMIACTRILVINPMAKKVLGSSLALFLTRAISRALLDPFV